MPVQLFSHCSRFLAALAALYLHPYIPTEYCCGGYKVINYKVFFFYQTVPLSFLISLLFATTMAFGSGPFDGSERDGDCLLQMQTPPTQLTLKLH